MKSLFKKIIVYFLTIESRFILKKYNPTIIAVTGSVGKTSTKDAIYTALASSCHIRKSDKSFNSEIGVPLTIIGCPNGWNDPIVWMKNVFEGLELILFKSEYPKCLVIEIGADHPHDIENITKWLKPNIAVITKVSDVPVHVEFFPSPEAVLLEKLFLAKALKPDGVLILSADDKKLMDASVGFKQKIITFGIANQGTIGASNVEMDIKQGISFKLNFENNSIPVKLNGVLGNQHIYPIIAATAVAIASNVPILTAISLLEKHIPPRGRMNLIPSINDSVIIDDTYNSSPDALQEALNALSTIQISGRKIAVLGDMMELGSFSASEHKKAGELALRSCNTLITVGPRARQMDARAIHFDSAVQAGEYLKSIVVPGDVILVKGSQSMRMERITAVLIAESDKASELLVRQEPEWLAKK